MTGKIYYLGLIMLIALMSSCLNKGKSKFEENKYQYFYDLDHKAIDTIIQNGKDTLFVVIIDNEFCAEKIYINGDSIEHCFGRFDDKGTFWVDGVLKYIRRGSIIDSQSEFLYVESKGDSSYFFLFGKKDLSCKILKHEVLNDSRRGKIIFCKEPKERVFKIKNDDLKGGYVSVIYIDTLIELGKKVLSEREVSINRKYQNTFQSHLGLLNDPRLKK